MSSAFKVFLLMLLLFGSFWAYQYRTRDFRAWLELADAPPPAGDASGAGSPVNGLIHPALAARTLATIYFSNPLDDEPFRYQDLADPPSGAIETIAVEEEEEEPPVPIVFIEESEDAAKAVPPPAEHDGKDSKSDKDAKAPKAGKDAKLAKAGAQQAPGRTSEKKEAAAPAERAKDRGKASKSEGKTEKGRAPKTERSRPAKSDPHAVPGDGSRPPARRSGPAVASQEPRQRGTVTHVVKENETLAQLARLYYENDTERWRSIYDANQHKIENPDELTPGTVIQIPEAVMRKASGPKGARKPAAKGGRPERTSERS